MKSMVRRKCQLINLHGPLKTVQSKHNITVRDFEVDVPLASVADCSACVTKVKFA